MSSIFYHFSSLFPLLHTNDDSFKERYEMCIFLFMCKFYQYKKLYGHVEMHKMLHILVFFVSWEIPILPMIFVFLTWNTSWFVWFVYAMHHYTLWNCIMFTLCFIELSAQDSFKRDTFAIRSTMLRLLSQTTKSKLYNFCTWSNQLCIKIVSSILF